MQIFKIKRSIDLHEKLKFLPRYALGQYCFACHDDLLYCIKPCIEGDCLQNSRKFTNIIATANKIAEKLEKIVMQQ